jgi:hypothetical protein
MTNDQKIQRSKIGPKSRKRAARGYELRGTVYLHVVSIPKSRKRAARGYELRRHRLSTRCFKGI